MEDFVSKDFDEFLEFCKYIGTEDEVITLLQRKFKKCNEHFLRSEEFTNLIKSLSEDMTNDPEKKYVLIRRLTTELGAYKIKGKRKLISTQEREYASKRQCFVGAQPSSSSACSSDTEAVKKTEKHENGNSNLTTSTSILGNKDENCAVERTDDRSVPVKLSNNAEVVPLTSEIPDSTKPDAISTDAKPDDQDIATVERDDSTSKDEVKIDRTTGTSKQAEHKDKTDRTDVRVARLEKLLGEYHAEIQILEEKEISLDDMGREDCTYILIDKYKTKISKVWDKLCQLKKRTTDTGRPIQKRFRYEGSRYPELNRKIEKFVTTRKVFPDFQDMIDIVNHVNKKYEYKLTKKGKTDLARDVFVEVGNLLQERRQEDVNVTFGCHLTDNFKSDRDPAQFDKSLRRKLEDNKEISKTKMEAVLAKFAAKQDDGSPSEESEEEEEEETKGDDEKVTGGSDAEAIDITDENTNESVPENGEVPAEGSRADMDGVDSKQQEGDVEICSSDSHVTNLSDDSDIEICEDEDGEPPMESSPTRTNDVIVMDSGGSETDYRSNLIDLLKDSSKFRIPEDKKRRIMKVVQLGLKHARASPPVELKPKTNTSPSKSGDHTESTSSPMPSSTGNKTRDTTRSETEPSSQGSAIIIESGSSQSQESSPPSSGPRDKISPSRSTAPNGVQKRNENVSKIDSVQQKGPSEISDPLIILSDSE